MGVTDDLTNPEAIDRPYEYFGRIRETDPVYHNEKWGGYIVTRYDDVKHCLEDDEHLSLRVQADRLRDAPHDIPETENMFPKWIIYLDPPEHTRLRQIMSDAFNPEMIRAQRAEAETITEGLIEEIKDDDPDEIELIDDFAFRLPVRIIGRIMGLPEEDLDRVGEWSKNIGYTLFHYYGVEDRHQKTEQAIREFADYVRGIVQERRAEPREDLITYLLEAETDGKTLTEDEVVAATVLLLFAGHETTTKLIANGTLELVRHPEQMRMLREDPSMAPKAVEEIIRYHGPSKVVTRGVVEDFELRGTRIEAGQRVLLSLAAANRDPRKFDDPETFDITRSTPSHLGFGHGIHSCIGAPLARLETRVAFPALVQAFPEMELATDEIEWTHSPLVRGPEELRLTL
ncbi:cytochrome P450 [Haloglomus litoreum]|uniref:cytochrome P450 n=1 Tax=Haloglomus litoreum TaxID=3034026 RepID=UPI0023E8E7AC|nr:cytochrome P450 [Haloglomus sp. DT116]